MGVQSLLELEYEPLHARERKISRMGFVRGRDIGREKKGRERTCEKGEKWRGTALGWMGLVSAIE